MISVLWFESKMSNNIEAGEAIAIVGTSKANWQFFFIQLTDKKKERCILLQIDGSICWSWAP